MNEINFLPQSFIRLRARKRRVLRESLLVVVVVVGMGVWYAFAQRGLQALVESAQGVQAQVATGEQDEEAKRLHARYVELARQCDAIRQLVSSVNASQVLATIASVTPPSVAVRVLELNDKGLDVWAAKTKERDHRKAQEEANKARGNTSKTKKAAAGSGSKFDPPIMEIKLEAVAPGDVQITDFVGRLTQHPLFGNVKLYYTRSTTVGEFAARQFSVQMEVRLDRRYGPAGKTQTAKEVAHAD
jgi:hypothetical protein